MQLLRTITVTWLAAGCLAATAAMAEDTIVSHGISTFGDLKYPADFTHFDYVNPDAPKGGTMSFRGTGASRTFDSLNPFILKGEPAQGIERIYDTLLVRAYDEPDAVYGLLAESLEYPEDRSYVIFNLRPEARFADGVPVTAEDVAFTFETLKTEGSALYQIRLKDVDRVEVLSPLRARVVFAEGASTRDLIAEVGQTEILPRHYYETVAFDAATLTPPLGSGPYVVDRADPGRSIRYCRNPDYWGAALPVNVGAHNFDCFVYEYFTDNTAAFESFKVGQYLFHEEFTSALWATNYEFPAIENGWILRETIPDDRPSGAQGFWMNTRRPNLQDPQVREAISMMFNFEWSNETLFYGLYERTDSFFENSDMEAEGLPEGPELALLEPYRDQLPETVFTEPAVTPIVSSTRQTDRQAVARAGALLDAAGWTVGADGLRRNAAGETLSFAFVFDGPAFERIVLPFIENLKKLGIDARSELIDSAQMEERQENFDYDMTVARFVLPLTPSVELRTLFGSESVNAPGTFNLSGVADPVVDALIGTVLAAESREDLNVAVRALDRVLRAKHLWAPNWHKGSHWIAYWDLFGRPEVKPLYDRGVDYWWYDADKAAALRAAGALR